jgi:hypothetical protein
MLGVERSTVSVAAGDLQRQGLIKYSRGQVSILEREGLESASCECYERIRSEYSRLVPLNCPRPPVEPVLIVVPR